MALEAGDLAQTDGADFLAADDCRLESLQGQGKPGPGIEAALLSRAGRVELGPRGALQGGGQAGRLAGEGGPRGRRPQAAGPGVSLRNPQAQPPRDAALPALGPGPHQAALRPSPQQNTTPGRVRPHGYCPTRPRIIEKVDQGGQDKEQAEAAAGPGRD